MTAGGLLAVFFTLGWLPVFVFRAEALTEALPHYQGAERWSVALAPIVIALHVTAACLALNFVEVAAWRALLSGAAFTLAAAFWTWGRLQIGSLRQTRLPQEPPLRFRRDGAFGIVRHPLYSAYSVAATAPVIAVPHWWLLLSCVAAVAAIATRAVQEERRLQVQLGAEYVAYCRDTKRLVPWVW